MSGHLPYLGHLVGPPRMPGPWRPAYQSPVTTEMLKRVVTGLERRALPWYREGLEPDFIQNETHATLAAHHS